MDFIDVKLLPPGDPKLIDNIVNLMKCQGIFDELRRESLADVDTTPAYQNLRHRVEGFVEDYLKDTQWRSDLNKNQLRDSVRRNINDSEMLTTGVDRIVDQVVTPKIHQVFLPKVTEIVHKFLGIEKKVVLDVLSKDETNGANVSTMDVSAVPSSTVETDRNDSFVTSSVSEKIETTTDKEIATKKVSKERKEDPTKGASAKTLSESQGSVMNKKQEQKTDSKTKVASSDKSKSKADSSQRKVLSSSSVKTKTTEVKAIKSKVTDKLKAVSKPKDQDSSSLAKDGTVKSVSDGKCGKLTTTKAKPVDDKTKSIVKTEKSKTDLEKTKPDVSKTEKALKEEGKTKFSNSSRFRSLGSNSKKVKPNDDKSSKVISNVQKVKSLTTTKSVDMKIKSTESTSEKSIKADPLPSKNIDKPKPEKSLSSGHKRTSSESKSSKAEFDGLLSKANKITKSQSIQKEEQSSQKEIKKEKAESDEKFQQETLREITKKPTNLDSCVELSPNKLVVNETVSNNEDNKTSFETEEASRDLFDVESSPVAIDSDSQSSLEEPSPKKTRKQKGKGRDEEGCDRHMSDDEMSDITVSSVHTSDLSDFDDNITLTESDDDEEKKVELNKRNAEIIVDRWDVECIVEYLLQTVEEIMAKVTVDVQVDEVTEHKETVDVAEDHEELPRSKITETESKLDLIIEPQPMLQILEPEEDDDDDWEPTKRKRSTQTAKLQSLSRDVMQKKSRKETAESEAEREPEPDRSEIEPRRELRRQRKLNPKYASDDFSSIFSRGSKEQNLFYEVPGRGDFVEAQAPIRGRRLTGHSNTTDETDCALSPVSDFSEFGDVGKSRKLSVGSRGKLCSPSEGSECSDYSRSHEASTPDQSDTTDLRPQTSSVGVAERKNKRERSKSPVEPSLPSPKVEGPSTRRHSRSEVTHESPPSTRQRTQRADRQRYDSTDLYKPRSTFSSSRRLRGMSSSSSSAAREEAIDEQETTQSVAKVRGRPSRRSADASGSPRGNKQSAANPSSNYSIKRRCRV